MNFPQYLGGNHAKIYTNTVITKIFFYLVQLSVKCWNLEQKSYLE